eukprot:gene6933-9352_t
MGGHAGTSFAISIASAALIFLVPYVAARYIGIYSVPLGMLASAALINPFIVVSLMRRGIRIVDLRDLPIPLVGVGFGLVALAFDSSWTIAAVAGIGCLLMASLAYVYLKSAKLLSAFGQTGPRPDPARGTQPIQDRLLGPHMIIGDGGRQSPNDSHAAVGRRLDHTNSENEMTIDPKALLKNSFTRALKERLRVGRRYAGWRAGVAALQSAERPARRPFQKLLIVPSDAWLIVGSRGDDAMVSTVIAEARKRNPHCEIGIVCVQAPLPAAATGGGAKPEPIWRGSDTKGLTETFKRYDSVNVIG